MNNRFKKVLKYTLSAAVAALLLYLAFRGMDWADFLEGLKTTGWGFILLSMAAGVGALVLRALRWKSLLKPLNPEVSAINLWHSTNYGNILNLAIPGLGEILRCSKASSDNCRFDRTFGTILVERAGDILAMVLLILMAVACNRGTLGPFMQEYVVGPIRTRFDIPLWWVFPLLVLLLALSVALAFRFEDRNRACAATAGALRGVWNGISSIHRMPHKIMFVVYTAGIWFMYILMFHFCVIAVPGLESLEFKDSLFFSAVGNMTAIIPTPGTLGPYHYLVGFSMSSICFGSAEILPMPLLCATLAHGSHAVLILLLALSSLLCDLIRKNKGNV